MAKKKDNDLEFQQPITEERAGGRSKTQAADRRRAGLAHGRPPRRNNTFAPSVLYHGNKDTSPRREPWERNRNPDQPRKGRKTASPRDFVWPLPGLGCFRNPGTLTP